jgi:hypothetical protein
MNLGARDRARTGDPQLGKLASESWDSASKSTSYGPSKIPLVTPGIPWSGLEGGEHRRRWSRDSNPGPVSNTSGIAHLFRPEFGLQQRYHKSQTSRWISSCRKIATATRRGDRRPRHHPRGALQVEAHLDRYCTSPTKSETCGTPVPIVAYPPIGEQLLMASAPPSRCRLKAPPGEAGHRRPSPSRVRPAGSHALGDGRSRGPADL